MRGSPVTTPISPKTLGADMRVTSFSVPLSPRIFTSTSPLVSTYSQCAVACWRVITSPRPNGAWRMKVASCTRSSLEREESISICSRAATRCAISRACLRSRCSGSSWETNTAVPGRASGMLDTTTITLLQSLRKRRIIRPVRQAPIRPSVATLSTAARTVGDSSNSKLMYHASTSSWMCDRCMCVPCRK